MIRVKSAAEVRKVYYVPIIEEAETPAARNSLPYDIRVDGVSSYV